MKIRDLLIIGVLLVMVSVIAATLYEKVMQPSLISPEEKSMHLEKHEENLSVMAQPQKDMIEKDSTEKKSLKEEKVKEKLHQTLFMGKLFIQKLFQGEWVSHQWLKEAFALYEMPLAKALEKHHAKMGDPLYLRIFKEESALEVWIKTKERFELLKVYRICAYSGELGPKLKEGDGQSPEGFYRVYKNALNPKSKFHLSFNLGFPNAYDRSHERTGSFLMVHGNCVSIGCYAMTDAKIEEIYALVEAALSQGQAYVPVDIFPFRMSEEKMADHERSQWYEFWSNLQEGYEYFESERKPPLIEVKGQRYEVLESIL